MSVPEPPSEDYAGHIVCEGITVPIKKVEIWGGEIRITASRWGPVPAAKGGPVTIFGSDGLGLCQGSFLSWPEVRDGDRLVTTLGLRMDVIYEVTCA